MKNHTLLIDGNSIGYAAQQATKLISGGMETQAAFGMIRELRSLRQVHPEYTPFVLWDGRAQWRFDLYPPYKGSRNSTPEQVAMKESYKRQRPYIARLLRHLGVRQLTVTSAEADDMGGYFAKLLSSAPGSKVGLITGDEDWMQLVRAATATSGEVWWKDPRSDGKFTNHKNFYDKTGCRTPFAFLETKILMGDGSDEITGVGGIGEKGAPEFIAEFGSVREFWRRCDAGEFVPRLKAHKRLYEGICPLDIDQWMTNYPGDPADAKALKKYKDSWPGQGRLIYKRNFQLMQLLKVPAPAKADVQLDAGKFDKEAFAEVCQELAFASILKNLDEFTNTFLQK
ncbi:5'-3' exonuclease H3TH domain-containing protein [Duganella sp. FT27W]|uniref:5'-3' exonuclease H3TH domain-containing protein n=1 Tax=Duganella sp. FT27W TaxID=2654636 RepID=UPI00128E780F|nr:5'-3' exonuclease H3TH domain-containing protein [Duganella sp. FT27W]MPQ56345.1 5'-3' exonuclease [Duganella sp. FT27W]